MSAPTGPGRILFVDTSALLRAYLISEAHSAQVQQALLDAEQIVVSLLARLEFTTALTQRAHRDHAARLSGRQFTLLMDSFKTDWETFNVVP